jgi:hypothetical protein
MQVPSHREEALQMPNPNVDVVFWLVYWSCITPYLRLVAGPGPMPSPGAPPVGIAEAAASTGGAGGRSKGGHPPFFQLTH